MIRFDLCLGVADASMLDIKRTWDGRDTSGSGAVGGVASDVEGFYVYHCQDVTKGLLVYKVGERNYA